MNHNVSDKSDLYIIYQTCRAAFKEYRDGDDKHIVPEVDNR